MYHGRCCTLLSGFDDIVVVSIVFTAAVQDMINFDDRFRIVFQQVLRYVILTVRGKYLIFMRVALSVAVISLSDRHLVELEYLVFVDAACVACIHVCEALHLVHLAFRSFFIKLTNLGRCCCLLTELDELIV